MISSNSHTAQELPRLPPGSAGGSQQAPGDQPINRKHPFGNIVTAVYAAIAREVKLKGAASRFIKTGPGRFAHRPDTKRS